MSRPFPRPQATPQKPTRQIEPSTRPIVYRSSSILLTKAYAMSQPITAQTLGIDLSHANEAGLFY